MIGVDVHPQNHLLPPEEREATIAEGRRLRSDIDAQLQRLQQDGQVAEQAAVGRVSRMIESYLKLGYIVQNEQRSDWLSALQTLLLHKRSTLSSQEHLLRAASKLAKKEAPTTFKPDFARLWQKLIALCEEDELAQASDSQHSKLLNTIAQFLRSTRYCLNDQDAKQIIELAMADVRKADTTDMFRGLLRLYVLMPTYHSHYDEYLPEWVATWLSVDNNAQWDAMWLTLFHRASKNVVKFNWASLIPGVATKCRRQLPVLAPGAARPAGKTMGTYARPQLGRHPWQPNISVIKAYANMLVFLCAHGEQLDGRGPEPLAFEFVAGLADMGPLPFPTHTFDSLSEGAVVLIGIFRAIRTAFHPSNIAGDFSACFELMKDICQQLLKWRALEVAGTLPYRRLDQKTYDVLAVEMIAYVQETTYSRQLRGMAFGLMAVQAIAVLSPVLASTVLVPFFARALQPSAVNNPHQAPAALQGLAMLAQSLLHPRPLLLQYLPDLLQQSLPGLDPNDPRKSVATLAFYTSVITWLPARGDVNDNYDPSWQPPPLPFSIGEGVYDPGHEAYERGFGIPAMLAEWSVEVARRLCVVFTTQEEVTPGRQLSIAAHMQQVMNSVTADFAAVFFQQMDEDTHQKVMDIMLDYFTTHTTELQNAKPLIEDCVEGMVFSQPKRLADVCRKLMQGVINPDGSIAASTTKTAFHLRMLAAAVRLPSSQLLCIRPQLEMLLTETFFCHEDKDIRKATCAIIARVLYALTGTFPSEIRSVAPGDWARPERLWTSYGKPAELESVNVQWHQPNAEQLAFAVEIFNSVVVGSIHQAQNLLSGASDSFSHDLGGKLKPLLSVVKHGIIGASEMLPISFNDDGDDSMVHTSMSALGRLSPEQRATFVGFRHRMAKFLHEIFVQISSSQHLQNNVKLLQGWSRLVEVVICTRTDDLKSSSKRQQPPQPSQNSFTNALHRVAEARWREAQAAGTSDKEAALPWNVHISPRSQLLQHVWILRRMRLSELSFATARKLRDWTTPEGEPLIDAFKTLLLDLHRLCCFDYVVVRQKAQKRFDGISARFGFLMDDFVEATLNNVNEEASSSHVTWGSLSLLSQERIMRRITGQWRHLTRFISVVLNAHTKISALAKTENEDQDMMNNTISTLFVKYIDRWQYIPVATEEHRQLAEEAITSLLGRFGVTSNSSSVDVTSTLPFRFELFAAWLLMHLVGHPDLTPQLEVWQWATALVKQAQDQPIQHIVLGTLARLLLNTKANLSNTESPLLNHYTTEQAESIRALCLQPDVVNGCFRAAVLSHQSADRKAQWAAGVDRMIHQASCRAGVRTFFKSLSTVSATTFKIRNVLLISMWTRVAGLEAVPLLLDAIAMAPAEQTDLEHVNRTRAEVFAGICHQVFRMPARSQVSIAELGTTFEANTRSLSLEFSQPWGCALRTVFAHSLPENQQPLVDLLLGHVSNVIVSTSEAGEHSSEEGFAAQARHILFAREAVREASLWDDKHSLAQKVRQLVIPNGLAIRYKAVRDEIAALIADLCHALKDDGFVDMIEEFERAVVDIACVANAESSGDGSADGGSSPMLLEQAPSATQAQHVALRQMAAATLAAVAKKCGPHSHGTVAPALVRIATLSLLWANSDLSKECRSAVGSFSYHLNCSARAALASNSKMQADSALQLLTVCFELAKSDSWQIRSTVLGVIGVVYALNQFCLTGAEKNEMLQRVLEALTDHKDEITEQARILLISFVHGMPPSYLKQWIETRMRIAGQYTSRRQQQQGVSAEHLTSVQILCAVIHAFPYDMPTFMPSVISAVVRHSSAPAPIGKIVSKTIQDFKRTHQDRWDDVKLFFTADQLEDLNDAAPTQHYFV